MRPPFLRAIPWFLLLLLAHGAALAQEQTPEEALAAIREQVLYANYPAATQAAEALLARPVLPAQQRLAALELLATVQIATRNRASAQTIAEIFRRDPEHRLSDPDASPTVIAAFQRARGQAQPVEVAMERQTPEQLGAREPPTVAVTLTGGPEVIGAVHELRLAYRNDPADSWSSVVMRVDPASGNAEARVPLAPGSAAYTLEWHVEARAPSGFVLGRLGAPDQPMTTSIPEEVRRVAVLGPTGPQSGGPTGPVDEGGGGVLSQWWFWTVAVAVVAGGAVGGYFLFGPPSEGPPIGDLGSGALR